MSYAVFILRRAQKALSKIRQRDRERIEKAIHTLSGDPRPPQSKKLRGRDGWRLRTGSYRTIYEIDDKKNEVTVLDIDHRRDVYR